MFHLEGKFVKIRETKNKPTKKNQALLLKEEEKKHTEMNTEGSDVGTRLARDPEDGKVTLIVESVGLGLEDGADSKLTLDGRDQRGALEQSTSKGLEGLAKGKVSTGNGVMESNDTNVAFSSTLLGLDEASRAINAKELMLAMCDHIFLSRLFHSHS